MKVVICGGGIMGCSTAYHLSRKGVSSVIIEEEAIACAASGKAGGFLAKDWCDHFEVGPLARASFDLHRELSQTLENTDYRPVDTLQVEVSSSKTRKLRPKLKLPDWIDGNLMMVDSMGNKETTAQVHPRKLCEALFASAQNSGHAELLKGRVYGFTREGAKLTGVKYKIDTNNQEISADIVVITMGPWSGAALEWLELPSVISGRRAHSVVLKPSTTVSAHSLFAEVGRRSAEVYPRPDGSVYLCGSMKDTAPLCSSPSMVQTDPKIAEELRKVGAAVSSVISEAEIEKIQACYLPISTDGLPLIGRLPNLSGAFIATGHSCWGILNSPATGKALADLIVDGKCTWLDLEPFDPQRLLI